MEIILNCDIVVASEKAQFALYEVKRGVVAVQGGLLPCPTMPLAIEFVHSDSETGSYSRSSGMLRHVRYLQILKKIL